MSVYQGPVSYHLLNESALSNSIRRIWVDYDAWLTALMYAVLFGTHDQSAVDKRLDKAVDDFGNTFAQFYGEDVGDGVRSVLTRFYQGIGDLAVAYRDNDQDSISNKRQALYDIADEFSLMYSKINRYWDRAAIQWNMYQMINDIETEIMLLSRKSFAQSIPVHDELMDHAYELADKMTQGILRQSEF